MHHMWIYLNNAHISIVETPDKDKPKFDDIGRKYLSVRARSVEDLKRFARVNDEDITVTPDRDYACRTFLPRHRVAGLLFESTCDIDYTNFKGSIDADDTDRHRWYGSVWSEGLTRSFRKSEGEFL